MNTWEILLINGVVIPVLKKVAFIIEENAKKTPDTWDDILATTFKTVIEVLGNPVLLKGK